MKKLTMFLVVSAISIGAISLSLGWAGYQSSAAPEAPLSQYVPAGAVLYLQAKDFSSLLADWNGSTQKQAWLMSSNYEVFSRSRLLLRLHDAGKQFATAAGLPPDMKFLTQVAGSQSVLALYDIGKLQFLYITRLPSANSMQGQLWQTRSKFESRTAGGVTFYLRRDPESEREVAFAVAGDYLLLATREDLMAGALELIAGSTNKDRSIEADPWWSQSVAAAGSDGDLRMVLNLDKLVPSPYFRSYWVQQNVTDMKQYSAAISDLFRSDQEYHEERVLLKKAGSDASSAGVPDDVSDLVRLVPDGAGFFKAEGCPSVELCLGPLEGKILAPRAASYPASPEQIAPQAQLTSGETGASSDLETRIDQASMQHSSPDGGSFALKAILQKYRVRAVLQVQSTGRDREGVFVKIHSAVALAGSSDWDDVAVRNATAEFVRPSLTASQLGVGWKQTNDYWELDGLRGLLLAVRGKYLVIADDPALLQGMLANTNRKLESKPSVLVAGFDHRRERENFARLATVVDRPDMRPAGILGSQQQPQFFSENIASLSSTLAGVSSEKIVVRDAGEKELQTITYEWSGQ
jgi:hypothetical protein